MAVESNITMYYEELVESMASMAIDNINDGGYGDEGECISQAIDDGLMYYCDQAYVLASAITRGYINWGKQFDWCEIWEMLYEDVREEIEYQKKQAEKEEE